MRKFTSQIHFVRVFLFSLLVLFGLLVSGNAYSKKSWNQTYMKLTFDRTQNAFVINMMFYDYNYGIFAEHAYLEFCTFDFSDDGVNYLTLMKANTACQMTANWSWICFSNKYPGAKISFFYEMHNRAQKADWNNEKILRLEPNHPHRGPEAWIKFIWYMNADFYNIQTIRISGKWARTGPFPDEGINYIAYDANKPQTTNSKFVSTKVMKPFAADTIVATVTKQADAIVVSGAKAGDTIEVTTITGQKVQTTVALSDVVKIKVPANQVYLVRVGEANYKVVM